ncbi:nucleoside triphosphate pyrophosphohydrolase family protein [Micromonospora sp. NPDC004551]|uniref:nucleoside triphosphate pyrophosphohydrolase family protein n=1 Tax=Micromonospora sp. NPDC004551 TaxID=3154284 RepID=UPI0033B227D1
MDNVDPGGDQADDRALLHAPPHPQAWQDRLIGLEASRPYWSAMDLDAYQRGALRTAAPRDKKNELLHLVLGLVGESGEVAEKFKKWVRDLDSDESRIDRADIAKELGDVLWYVAVLADYLDLSLNDIAATNLAKLASRQGRGVLGGSGDNR